MLIRVDVDSPHALYDQVAASVRADILSGALAPGDRLPAARDVAAALSHEIDGLIRRAAALGVSAETLAGIVRTHRAEAEPPIPGVTPQEAPDDDA